MSKPNKITIDDVEYVRADSLQNLEPAVEDGLRYCIVRCRDAGVHSGFVVEKGQEGRTVKIFKSRRLWSWHAKTLSGLATEGITNEKECKFANEVPEITVLDACEIIPCSKSAMSQIRNFKEWVNE